jgi:hypothetical protein
MASPHAGAVREAVSAAVRAYQGNPSIWKALLPFERSLRKAELIKTILEVILQHRLRMFQVTFVALSLICLSICLQQDLETRKCNTRLMLFGVELAVNAGVMNGLPKWFKAKELYQM